MDVYRTDEEQIEVLKRWFEENGISVIAGIVLGLGAIFGWRGWQNHKIEQAGAASLLYQKMIIAERDDDNRDKARETAEKIVADYGSTAYAVFAKLTLAKLAADANDFDSAAMQLRWALEHTNEKSLEHLVRLRLARVVIAQGNYDAALKLLESGDPGQFESGYDELRGDIFTLKGKLEPARNAYQQAITNKRASHNDISALQMKLDDLGQIGQQ
ncbi:MAG: YfgM family protein [Gammaproteobacteria bacterium]